MQSNITNDGAQEQPRGSGLADMFDQQLGVIKRAAPFEPIDDARLTKIIERGEVIHLKEGDTLYSAGDHAEYVFVILSGRVRHALGPDVEAGTLVRTLGASEVIGWAAILDGQPTHMATVTCLSDVSVFRIDGAVLLESVGELSKEVRESVMRRFTDLIRGDFTMPSWTTDLLRVMAADADESATSSTNQLTGMALTMYRIQQWFNSPKPYLLLLGFGVFFGFWYLACTALHLPRFSSLPGPIEVINEWFSKNPVYGTSIYTPAYYTDIISSVRRVAEAFVLATALGVPLGLLLGWSKSFREYVFPVFETLRPIPILAWVPLAILMFYYTESAVVYLTFLASFFATALNTKLGVDSIDESFPRAAACLGASRWQVFRHVIIPGALPFIFTGLQISVGVAWFSLVAAEMISGQYGLGYLIMTSYTMVQYPVIVIGMATLGIVGYATSALVRIAGDYLMQWRVRELALGGQR